MEDPPGGPPVLPLRPPGAPPETPRCSPFGPPGVFLGGGFGLARGWAGRSAKNSKFETRIKLETRSSNQIRNSKLESNSKFETRNEAVALCGCQRAYDYCCIRSGGKNVGYKLAIWAGGRWNARGKCSGGEKKEALTQPSPGVPGEGRCGSAGGGIVRGLRGCGASGRGWSSRGRGGGFLGGGGGRGWRRGGRWGRGRMRLRLRRRG